MKNNKCHRLYSFLMVSGLSLLLPLQVKNGSSIPPTSLTSHTHFGENILKFSLYCSRPPFLASHVEKLSTTFLFRYSPIQKWNQVRVLGAYPFVSQMGKGKSGGWVKLASVGVCSTLTIWALYVVSGKFLEDKFYIYILHPLSYIKTFP